MQVERESGFGREYSGGRVRTTWITCLKDRNNLGKPRLMPDMTTASEDAGVKGGRFTVAAFRGVHVLSGCWWGKGLPSLRRVAGLSG